MTAAEATSVGRREHVRGLVLCATGVIVISPDALIIRTVRTDAWSTVCWRGIFTLVGTLVVLAVLAPGQGPRAPRPTRSYLFAGALFAAASVAFVSALDRSDAASVLVIIAAGPLIASVLGRVFLREPAHVRTWLTGAAVLADLVVILGGSLGRGEIDGRPPRAGRRVVLRRLPHRLAGGPPRRHDSRDRDRRRRGCARRAGRRRPR